MVAAVLFTRPDPRMGPAETNLFQVRGMAKIVAILDGMEWTYRGAAAPVVMRRNPAAQDAVILRRHGRPPLNLASVPGAIAVAIDEGGHGRLFWFNDHGFEHEPIDAARAHVAARCRPFGGYDLPG